MDSVLFFVRQLVNNLIQSVGTPASRLLVDDNPLLILPSVARKIGDRHAYILQQIHYWLTIFQEGGKERKFIDGRWWVYNTADEWQKTNFPWLSARTVQRVLQDLEKMGLVITAKLEASEYWNQRKWYSIDYDAISALKSLDIEVVTLTANAVAERVSAHVKQLKSRTSQNGKMEQAILKSSIEPKWPVDLYSEITSETNNTKNNGIIISDENRRSMRSPSFEQGTAKNKGDGPGQPSSGLNQRKGSAAPPRQKWNPEQDDLTCDRHGWLKLPSVASTVGQHREAVSRAKAIAVRHAQLWMIGLGMDRIEIVEGEDGEDWIEHINGTEPIDVALGRGGDLTLLHLRCMAMNQGLISQEEFNTELLHAFWDSIEGSSPLSDAASSQL